MEQETASASPADAGRAVIHKIRRTSGTRIARFVQIPPGQHGGMFGHALHLYAGGQQVFAKFLPFGEAIRRGNEHAGGRGEPEPADDDPSDGERESGDAPALAATPLEEHVKGNVRITLDRNAGQLVGFHLRIYVDGFHVIQLFKDGNTGPVFDFPTASAKAREFLETLQGWVKDV